MKYFALFQRPIRSKRNSHIFVVFMEQRVKRTWLNASLQMVFRDGKKANSGFTTVMENVWLLKFVGAIYFYVQVDTLRLG